MPCIVWFNNEVSRMWFAPVYDFVTSFSTEGEEIRTAARRAVVTYV
jgi:hypothetical protein